MADSDVAASRAIRRRDRPPGRGGRERRRDPRRDRRQLRRPRAAHPAGVRVRRPRVDPPGRRPRGRARRRVRPRSPGGGARPRVVATDEDRALVEQALRDRDGRPMSDPADERDFLLRSLEDLEREHDAGDVDDADYAALKDDYTAARRGRPARSSGRRARVPRRRPQPRARSCWRGVLGVRGRGRGARGPGVRPPRRRRHRVRRASDQSVTEKLNEAGRLLQRGRRRGRHRALRRGARPTSRPTPRPSPTRAGPCTRSSATPRTALTSLIDAATADRDYPDVHAFLAVRVLPQRARASRPSNELDRLDALDPPPDMLAQIDGPPRRRSTPPSPRRRPPPRPPADALRRAAGRTGPW